jgi:ubiquinone/menaquinone biosynthesis C-methylase UbiE
MSGGTELPSAFTTVDDAADPGLFIGWMDEVRDLPDIARTRAAAVDALRLSAGDVVLDVGCGTGDVAVGLVPLVHPGGRIVGVEAGDAQKLAFGDGTFDACRCERVLIHVPDAARALGGNSPARSSRR